MTKAWFRVFLRSVRIFISLNGMFSIVVIMKAWFRIFFNLNEKSGLFVTIKAWFRVVMIKAWFWVMIKAKLNIRN